MNWWKGETARDEGLFPSNFVTSDLTEPESRKFAFYLIDPETTHVKSHGQGVFVVFSFIFFFALHCLLPHSIRINWIYHYCLSYNCAKSNELSKYLPSFSGEKWIEGELFE